MSLRGALASVICLAAGVRVVSAQTVTVPSNYSTIQSAINAVVSGSLPNGTVIQIQPGTYHEALLINTSSRSLTLRGLGGPATTIVNAAGSGQPALRIYRETGAVRIEGLALRGGTGIAGTGGGFTFEDASPLVANVVVEQNTGLDAGGGVLTRSNAQFSDCFIRNNSAARFGGGVVITTGSRPTFSNCQILNNVSGTGGSGLGNIGSGGGVHVNDASPTFRGCLIAGNQSKFAAGGIFHMGLFGSSYGPAVLVLENTEVSGNVASRFSAADNPAEGGGVHVEDNAVGYLIRATIRDNTANTSGGLSAYRARYQITDSVIESNHAQDPAAIGGFGGGIGISSNNISTPLRQAGSLVLIDSVVRGNDARVGAGIFASGDQVCGSSCDPNTATRASVQIKDSIVASNTAGLYGGGLRMDRVTLTLTNSHVLQNTVAASGQSYGGGILLALGSQATISGTTIAANSAVNFGGGLFVDGGAAIALTGSTVYRNSASNGGGLYVGNNGPPSGTVQSSTLADNTGFQIYEQACAPLSPTILSYQNNIITPRSGQSDLYKSTCGGQLDLAHLNTAASGRSSGNTSTTPQLMSLLAAPSVGPAVLSWSVSRASSVSISGIGTFNGDTGTTAADPDARTTYTLSAAGGPGGTANAVVDAARFWGSSADTPVTGDFDGDGRQDLAVYRGSTGQWFIQRSRAGFLQVNWGSPAFGDLPVPADYDGDGKTDIGIFRQATGEWFILNSGTGTTTIVGWGAPSLGDTPVPADYDGDHRADIAVYRASTGEWFIRQSRGGVRQFGWGSPTLGDIPVPADYDGDGKVDVAVFRPGTAQWFLAQSTAGTLIVTWGGVGLGDTPVPADYDGDGRADVAVARQQTGEWFVKRSGGGLIVASWGFGDRRVSGDYAGNGNAQIATWVAQSGTWLIQP